MESVIRELLNELVSAGIEDEGITSGFPDKASYSDEVGTADDVYQQMLGEIAITDFECKCCKEWLRIK